MKHTKRILSLLAIFLILSTAGACDLGVSKKGYYLVSYALAHPPKRMMVNNLLIDQASVSDFVFAMSEKGIVVRLIHVAEFNQTDFYKIKSKGLYRVATGDFKEFMKEVVKNVLD